MQTYYKINILFLFLIVSTVAKSQLPDPGSSGITPTKSPIAVNETASVFISLGNFSSGTSSDAGNIIELFINLPNQIRLNGEIDFSGMPYLVQLASEPTVNQAGTTIIELETPNGIPANTVESFIIPIVGHEENSTAGNAQITLTIQAIFDDEEDNNNQSSPILVEGTLPVTISNFEVEANKCAAKINWTTASEINNSHFLIQRSSDGSNFETIGSVDGAGTSSSQRNYSFEDQLVSGRKYFYRLQQVDFDGRKSYSSIEDVNISCGDAGSGLMYPNPVNNTLYIKQSNTGVQTIELYNIVGQLVLSQEINEVNHISVNGLSQGTYYAVAKDNKNRIIVSEKLIKVSK